MNTIDVTFDSETLNDALMTTQDLLDRCQIRFFALKETAKQIKHTSTNNLAELNLKIIELGVEKKDLNEGVYPILKDMFDNLKINPQYSPTFIRFEFKGVPVFIKIIQRKYKYFQNPNPIFYRYATFNLPNPFDSYWYARNIIK